METLSQNKAKRGKLQWKSENRLEFRLWRVEAEESNLA
jgi:hypothetical protein